MKAAVGAMHTGVGLAEGDGLAEASADPVGVGVGVGVDVGVGDGEGVEATPPLGAVASWAVALDARVMSEPPINAAISGVSSVK